MAVYVLCEGREVGKALGGMEDMGEAVWPF